MRIPCILLIALFTTAVTRAGPIRLERIPADAIGYFHVDIDRLLASQLARELASGVDLASLMKAQFGGQISSFTMCPIRRDGTTRLLIIVHGDQSLRQRTEAQAAKAKDAVVMKIGNQDVYYSSGPQFLLQSVDSGPSRGNPEPESQEPAVSKLRPMFSMGFEGGNDDFKTWSRGPTYTALVGQDLILATAELRLMADALDVLAGKKPSLATQDPQGLKRDTPPGAIVLGAGITAYVAADSPTPTRPGTTQPAFGNFDLDFFSALKGKARLAHFDIGEDAQSIYLNTSIGMADPESAAQLKNLAIGVKALLSLSQVKQTALINPLEVQAVGSNVTLHWSWPTAKLSELVRLIQTGTDADARAPTTHPGG